MDDGVDTNYHALRLSAQHRFSHNFTLLSVYTYSHCLQTGEVIADRISLGANTYQNPANRNADYGDCDADLRHNLVNSVVYQTPKASQTGEQNLLLGKLAAFILDIGALGISVLSNDRNRRVSDGHRAGPAQRCRKPLCAQYESLGLDQRCGVCSKRSRHVRERWLQFAHFSRIFRHGYEPDFHGFFRIRERQRIELRFEFFNMLNHTNFNAPVNSIKSSAFGVIQAVRFIPRILQFALKYTF